ncbi:Uncharacterised protein [Mycobacteroides abscessus subsp. abscessus]|nr:Uncharacterised protein [Mycobacteroides abscessus subsp. abscessus]SKV56754.1 Uncharacterised protein [Mycobacteroides abscessus subsp. abscessus]
MRGTRLVEEHVGVEISPGQLRDELGGVLACDGRQISEKCAGVNRPDFEVGRDPGCGIHVGAVTTSGVPRQIVCEEVFPPCAGRALARGRQSDAAALNEPGE